MSEQNPFLTDWTQEFALPPFHLIKDEHYATAFNVAFQQVREAINMITIQSQPPTFENTIEALERSDILMDKVSGVFSNIASSNSSPEIEALHRNLSPKWA